MISRDPLETFSSQSSVSFFSPHETVKIQSGFIFSFYSIHMSYVVFLHKYETLSYSSIYDIQFKLYFKP